MRLQLSELFYSSGNPSVQYFCTTCLLVLLPLHYNSLGNYTLYPVFELHLRQHFSKGQIPSLLTVHFK